MHIEINAPTKAQHIALKVKNKVPYERQYITFEREMAFSNVY